MLFVDEYVCLRSERHLGAHPTTLTPDMKVDRLLINTV
jgi:hypothetical protein